jgi:hypothetical protein
MNEAAILEWKKEHGLAAIFYSTYPDVPKDLFRRENIGI